MFIYVFIIGLIVGSFVNVVIYRIPARQSIVFGRSSCTHCLRKLSFYDLVPLISFLILGGRCRSCNKKISLVYPIVEACSGFIFLFSYLFFAHIGTGEWIFIVFILELFLILAVIDIQHLLLPDSLLLVLLAGAVSWSANGLANNKVDHWQVFDGSSLLGAGLLMALLFAVWFLSNGRGLGLGDIKLVGIIGLLFGFWGGLTILYIAIVTGALFGVALISVRRANLKTKLPLGTFFSAAVAIYVFFGSQIVRILSEVFYSVPFIVY
ncbi:MAG: prepilin peptidase [Patescibacteria group bacterium]